MLQPSQIAPDNIPKNVETLKKYGAMERRNIKVLSGAMADKLAR